MPMTFLASLKIEGPRWPYIHIWLHALIGAIGLTTAVWAICSALGMPLPKIFAENAAHEQLQSLVLGIAVVAGVVALVRCSGLASFAALAVGLISSIGFFREMPSCRGDILVFCAASTTRGSFMAACALALVVAVVFFELRVHGTIIKAIHPRLSWPLALATMSLGASQISENLHLVVLEETLELYSYLVLMLSTGWLALKPPSLLGSGMAATPNYAVRPLDH